MTKTTQDLEFYKKQYQQLQQGGGGVSFSGRRLQEEARTISERLAAKHSSNTSIMDESFTTSGGQSRAAESVASLSSLAQHAKTLVGNFQCGTNNNTMEPPSSARSLRTNPTADELEREDTQDIGRRLSSGKFGKGAQIVDI